MAVFILLHLVALHDSSGSIGIFYFYLILRGILHPYLGKYFTYYYEFRYLIIIVLIVMMMKMMNMITMTHYDKDDDLTS
jgi:hypothetical protein